MKKKHTDRQTYTRMIIITIIIIINYYYRSIKIFISYQSFVSRTIYVFSISLRIKANNKKSLSEC